MALWQSFKNKTATKTTLNTHGSQIIGRRDSQQDRYDIHSQITLSDSKTGTLLLLADGMGGHRGGEIASQIIVDAFYQVFNASTESVAQLFEQALAQSNASISQYIASHPEYDGMGSTVVAVLVVDDALYWFSVGDSPLWLIRGGQLHRLNEDHSMLPVLLKMAEMGEIAIRDVYQDPNRHTLRSVIQGKTAKLVDSHIEPFKLEVDDILILASDGLQSLSEPLITQLVTSHIKQSCESVVTSLLNEVGLLNIPTQDNTTVIVATLAKGDAHG